MILISLEDYDSSIECFASLLAKKFISIEEAEFEEAYISMRLLCMIYFRVVMRFFLLCWWTIFRSKNLDTELLLPSLATLSPHFQ